MESIFRPKNISKPNNFTFGLGFVTRCRSRILFCCFHSCLMYCTYVMWNFSPCRMETECSLSRGQIRCREVDGQALPRQGKPSVTIPASQKSLSDILGWKAQDGCCKDSWTLWLTVWAVSCPCHCYRFGALWSSIHRLFYCSGLWWGWRLRTFKLKLLKIWGTVLRPKEMVFGL